MCSDHFSPWSERQGESGFAWSFLGAALAATRCPSGWSTRPASATTRRSSPRPPRRSSEMFPGRLWVALGTGEASNEHITGEPWPPKRGAQRRGCASASTSCARCSPARWSSHDGLVRVDRAKLWTLPAEPPPLHRRRGVASRRRAGAAAWADGLVTINQPREHAASGDRRRSARAAARASRCASRCTVAGRPTRTRRCGSPTTSGARTSSRRRCAGTCTPSSSSTRRASTCGPRTCGGACSSRPTSAGTSRGCASSPTLGFDADLPAPRRPGPAPVHRRLRRARAPGAGA